MKNKRILVLSLLCIITLIALIINGYYFNKKLEENNNKAITSILYILDEKDVDISRDEIMDIINCKDLSKYQGLEKYGIDKDNEYVLLSNKKIVRNYYISLIVIIVITFCLVIMVLIFYKKKRDKELKELLSYLKRINKKNYKIEIKKNSEGDYSLLLNELYKTAVMLNEQSELSRKDKESLKNSLSDISHQLRTPLTSINLMIDNVMNEETPEAEKKKLLRDINHKIKNTSFLIENLLKLSKFDANTINFKKEYIYVSKILDDVKDNLSLLLDLKDINLNISGDKKIRVNVDPKWEVEAISNIVKNAIEYSNESSKIDITYEHNDIFTKLVIRDYGCGMSKKDQKHIFERFYKGEKSSGNSIGIGMSLAKMIIEKDNGTINVESSEEGTKFIIKYFNN